MGGKVRPSWMSERHSCERIGADGGFRLPRHQSSTIADGLHTIRSSESLVVPQSSQLLTIWQPSSAASSFMSGLIREPLQGKPSECPVASSPSDPILDNMPVYVTRTKTVVRNIAYALCMPATKFIKGQGRSISLPGFSITTRDILKSLYVSRSHRISNIESKTNRVSKIGKTLVQS